MKNSQFLKQLMDNKPQKFIKQNLKNNCLLISL